MDAIKWQLKLRVAKFVLSNRTRAACLFDFEITRMITDQIRFTRLHRKIYVFSRWRPFASSLVILLFFSDKPLVLKQFIKRPPLGSTYLGMVPRPRFVCCQRDCFISGPRPPKEEWNVVTGSPGAIFVRALVKWYTTGWIEIDVKFDGTVWSGMVRAGKIKQVCCLII